MSSASGGTLDGVEHLRQSIVGILTTPIGSRVMRRDYGSELANLIDGNVTQLTIAQIYAATADALDKWEPRLRVERVQLDAAINELQAGQLALTIYGQYLPDGIEVVIEGVVV